MKSNITIQDAKVRRPILAVIDAIKAGNLVLYGDGCSCIITANSPEGRTIIKAAKGTKRKVGLEQVDGVFVMPSWVVPPADSKVKSDAPFQRHGKP